MKLREEGTAPGYTSITLTQETAMKIRRIKLDMSELEGRVVPQSEVMSRLIALWYETRGRP